MDFLKTHLQKTFSHDTLTMSEKNILISNTEESTPCELSAVMNNMLKINYYNL